MGLSLNSSIYNLKSLEEGDCIPYMTPPRPHCQTHPSTKNIKYPAIIATWKLDGGVISIPALCFGAFNITYQCDWRPLIYSSQTILSSTPIRWPWVEYPNESDMRVNATSLDKSVYLDGPLDYQCSFGRLTQRSAIKRIAQKCTLTVNKDGSVMSDAFQDCYLLKSSKCISLTTHLIAVPVSIPKSISACPVIVVDIDVALVEMQTSRPSYISAIFLLLDTSIT